MSRWPAAMVAVLMTAPLAATSASADRRILIFDPVGDASPGVDPAVLGEEARSAAASAWPTARVLTGLNLRILLRSAKVELAACGGQVLCELEVARGLGAEIAVVGTLRRERDRIVLGWVAYDVPHAMKLGESSARAPVDEPWFLMDSSAVAAIAALSNVLGEPLPVAPRGHPQVLDAGTPVVSRPREIDAGTIPLPSAPDAGAAVASLPPEVDAGAAASAPDGGAAVVALPPEVDAGAMAAVPGAPDGGAAVVSLPPEVDAGTSSVPSAPDAGAAVVSLPPEVDAGAAVAVPSVPKLEAADAGEAVLDAGSAPADGGAGPIAPAETPDAGPGAVAAAPEVADAGTPDAGAPAPDTTPPAGDGGPASAPVHGSDAGSTEPMAPVASAPQPVGYLQISARGPDGKVLFGATVTIDGKPVGTTPFSGPVAAGEHAVAVVSPAGSAFRQLVVAPASVQQVELSIGPGGAPTGQATPAATPVKRAATVYFEAGGGLALGMKPGDDVGEYKDPGIALHGGVGLHAGKFAVGAMLGFTSFKGQFTSPIPYGYSTVDRELAMGGATVAYFPAPMLVLRAELEAGQVKYKRDPTTTEADKRFAAGAMACVGLEGLIGDHLLLGLEASGGLFFFDTNGGDVEPGAGVSVRLAFLL